MTFSPRPPIQTGVRHHRRVTWSVEHGQDGSGGCRLGCFVMRYLKASPILPLLQEPAEGSWGFRGSPARDPGQHCPWAARPSSSGGATHAQCARPGQGGCQPLLSCSRLPTRLCQQSATLRCKVYLHARENSSEVTNSLREQHAVPRIKSCRNIAEYDLSLVTRVGHKSIFLNAPGRPHARVADEPVQWLIQC